ncbi:MAG: AAA family ATPase [Clostridia bacterium]|nr:AAA family ATPase [Clostridia bacterium]
MKKLPYGISNYEDLITQNYYYVDKTRYIEQLENIAEKNIVFLRPRKFGKTLFTSTIQYYYDINESEKFNTLFGETYIGKNPTPLKNSYYILRFNFSGIDTSTLESTISGFKNKVIVGIENFVGTYGLDFYINKEEAAENLLSNLFIAFKLQKRNEKIYVIIDEYDHFANELLSFQPDNFKSLVSRNGKVRKWYEILKEGTERVVDRIFITGVTPITLDSMTSGFNIGTDKTRNAKFNEMLGFTKLELKELMEELEIGEEEQEKLFPILKENYDGYKFNEEATEKMYNSTLCLYFFNRYIENKKVPSNLLDVNIASDYSKIAQMLTLCKSNRKKEILEEAISDEGISADIINQFNAEQVFGENEFVSMLFYLGYLTIKEESGLYAKLVIPNKTMKELYSAYFLKIVADELDMQISINYADIGTQMILEGKIDKAIEILRKYLNNLSNRDFQNFDEKYVKLIFYCIAMNIKAYSVRSEQENNRKYQDILLIPTDTTKGYQAILIEFKYLKKTEAEKLEETKIEARKQVENYGELEQIKNISNLNKYIVIAVNDEIYVERID